MQNFPKLSLEELERMNGARYSAEHKCDKNPVPDSIFMVFCTSYADDPLSEWQLHHFWLATQEQVDAGEYSGVGEVIASNAFVIGWCPFCGKGVEAAGARRS
jgi:hypothetical protein